jgi:hypothetical protein
VDGFYDPLLALVDHMAAEGFVAPQQRAMVLVDDDAEALLARVAAYHPPSTALHLTPAET